MVTLIIYILILLGFILVLFHLRKSGLILLGLGIICFFAIGLGYVPHYLLNYLQRDYVNNSSPNWSTKNVIVALTGGNIVLPVSKKIEPNFFTYSRMFKAAQLYFDCKKTKQICKLLLSGGDSLHTGEPESEAYFKKLLAVGVPADDMILDTKSLNTFVNARDSYELTKNGGFQQYVLVTSGVHLKRATLYFQFFNMNPYPVPADDYTLTQPYGYSMGFPFALTDFATHEIVGIYRFYIYNYFGWNKPPPGV